MLVAAWAPNRPGFTETEGLIATWSSLGIAVVAVGFAFIRDWRTAVRGVCFGLGFFGVLFGAAFALFAAAAVVCSTTGATASSTSPRVCGSTT